MPIFLKIKFHANKKPSPPNRAARTRIGRGSTRLWAVLSIITCLFLTIACLQTPAFIPTHDLGQGGGNPNDIFSATPTNPLATAQVIHSPVAVTVIAGGPYPTKTPTPIRTPRPPILYYAQSGDVLSAVAARFDVSAADITSPDPIPVDTLINPDQLLIIPDVLDVIGSTDPLLPDSEIVYSPSTVGFDVEEFTLQAGGYLSTYREYLNDGFNSGWQVIDRVAMENSFNPRLLLALLEYQSGWVYGQPQNMAETEYPLGHIEYARKGLYKQLTWAAHQLTTGYYGWRSGSMVELTFWDGSKQRIAPGLNAGSATLQYIFAQLYEASLWPGTLYGPNSFISLHASMFGDPWLRDQQVKPLFPAFTQQPDLALPFLPGKPWALTGGPHPAWGPESVVGALDFAPSSDINGCYDSMDYVTAPAAGLVARTGAGLVVFDLDGDGHEQTGWVLILMHIAARGRVSAGEFIDKDDKIGHPSCEGGRSTGTHVHIARKFNGEWIPIEGPLPFVLSGWTAHTGDADYEGSLTKDGMVVKASVYADSRTNITRTD